MYCYFDRPIGRGSDKIAHKCCVFGSINLLENVITLTKNHNHGPNKKYAEKLRARNKILERVRREPENKLRHIFDEEQGSAHGLSFGSLYRTMRRLRPRNVIDLMDVSIDSIEPTLSEK